MLTARDDWARMDADTGRRLREADWADLGIRLTAYATWKARNYRWRTRQVWALAAGQTPEDVAREAIAKVLDGTRTWEPQRGPLLPFLQGIVDSLMSHLAASADNAIIERWHDAIPDAAAPEEPDDSEAAELINRLRGALEQHGGDDLLAVLGAVQEHGARPSAIAVALGTSVIDVNNRLKRLRRVALRLLHAAPARKRA